ncbi:MAG: mechanosensitive ion channel family protein, partial [Candidatus Latescibacteria bacterium]|nr:mechanosensitive ion channel family protein [Candidatus Latescibacterota bacterium]
MEFLHNATGLKPYFTELLFSVVIILVLWLVRNIVVRIIMRRTDDVRTRYVWQKTLTYAATFLGIFFLVRVWFSGNTQPLFTFFGFLSAGVAIALKDILTNVAGWVFIIWARPIDIGDRIQIGKYAGDVVDKSILHITLMEIGNWVDSDQSTGRVVKVPNSFLFSEAFANYSQGFYYIWNEIAVLITFESNWKKAKELLSEIAWRHTEKLSEDAEQKVREASKRYLIFYNKLTPIVYTSVKDSGVMLTIRYLCEPRKRRGTQEDIWEDIL